MGRSLEPSLTPQDASDFARLADVVQRLANGQAADWRPQDPALAAAVLALSRVVAHTGRSPSAARGGIGDRSTASQLVLARVDRFEDLASRVGDSVATAVLGALSARVLATLQGARIGRLGRGVIELVFEPSPQDGVEAALAGLRDALEQPICLQGETLRLSIVMGAAALGENGPLSEAVRQAERALARAELEGLKWTVFSEIERAEASERLSMMRDLRECLAADGLSLAYQPKLNVRSGRIDSVEALARWRHPVRGVVSPDQFIALAEDTGDIARVTEAVLAMAIRDQAVLAASGRSLSVFVNLSGRLVADEAFCAWIRQMCAGAAGRIGLEITETAVIADPERALRNLRALAEADIEIAIDDYGSGLSSLAYLKALPAKELKIDKAFVQGLSSSHRDPLIVRSTIDLAHALQMQVTAEGVDDPTAFALLRVMGCDRVQGYLIAPPLSLPDLGSFLADQEAGAAEPAAPSASLLSLGR